MKEITEFTIVERPFKYVPNRPARSRVEGEPKFSIIIPAHNEGEYLLETLEALWNLDYPDFEVIVVANGCDDDTEWRAKQTCSLLINVSEKSIGIARNIGAEAARGEILVFLDADTVIGPSALKVIALNLKQEYAVATLRGIPDDSSSRFHLFYGLKNLMHSWGLHKGSSGVIICRREQFFRAGRFHRGLEVRENSDLIRRLMRFGKYKYISDTSAVTSMRRFYKKGLLRSFVQWGGIWLKSFFGAHLGTRYESVR